LGDAAIFRSSLVSKTPYERLQQAHPRFSFSDLALEARDFVLYQQLAALQLGDLEIVD
jgi:hypothetical protein